MQREQAKTAQACYDRGSLPKEPCHDLLHVLRLRPRVKQILNSLLVILDKAEAHAADKKIDPAALTQFRLFPDMLAFNRQIQIAADFAKGCSARLAGVDVPSYEDSEQTFAELKARISKTLAFIDSVPQAESKRAPSAPSPPAAAKRPATSPARNTCCTTRCRTSSSTPPPPTTSCATTAWKSARKTSSAPTKPTARARRRQVLRRG